MSVSVADSFNAHVVLVVEDEFLVRLSIASFLRDAGYIVVDTASGEVALAICKSDTSIDLVFTDIGLSGSATGWDVAECFRVERPEVPVLYTSGKAVDIRRCISRSEFVAKPYENADILKAFERLQTT